MTLSVRWSEKIQLLISKLPYSASLTDSLTEAFSSGDGFRVVVTTTTLTGNSSVPTIVWTDGFAAGEVSVADAESPH